MDAVEKLLPQPVVQQIGWVLVHFLWQGVAIAMLLACGLYILRRRSPQARWLAVSPLSALTVGVAVAVTLSGGCGNTNGSPGGDTRAVPCPTSVAHNLGWVGNRPLDKAMVGQTVVVRGYLFDREVKGAPRLVSSLEDADPAFLNLRYGPDADPKQSKLLDGKIVRARGQVVMAPAAPVVDGMLAQGFGQDTPVLQVEEIVESPGPASTVHDLVIRAEVVSVGQSPGFWSGTVVATQPVAYKVKQVLRGQLPAGSTEITVHHVLIGSAPFERQEPPGLDPAFFWKGRVLTLSIETTGPIVPPDSYYVFDDYSDAVMADGTAPAEQVADPLRPTVIVIGMPLAEAKQRLQAAKARETLLQTTPPKSPHGGYMRESHYRIDDERLITVVSDTPGSGQQEQIVSLTVYDLTLAPKEPISRADALGPGSNVEQVDLSEKKATGAGQAATSTPVTIAGMELTMAASKATYTEGEPVAVTVTWRNRTDKPITVKGAATPQYYEVEFGYWRLRDARDARIEYDDLTVPGRGEKSVVIKQAEGWLFVWTGEQDRPVFPRASLPVGEYTVTVRPGDSAATSRPVNVKVVEKQVGDTGLPSVTVESVTFDAAQKVWVAHVRMRNNTTAAYLIATDGDASRLPQVVVPPAWVAIDELQPDGQWKDVTPLMDALGVQYSLEPGQTVWFEARLSRRDPQKVPGGFAPGSVLRLRCCGVTSGRFVVREMAGPILDKDLGADIPKERSSEVLLKQFADCLGEFLNEHAGKGEFASLGVKPSSLAGIRKEEKPGLFFVGQWTVQHMDQGYQAIWSRAIAENEGHRLVVDMTTAADACRIEKWSIQEVQRSRE